MAYQIETLLQDPELTLRWLPGRSPRLVVVFTGMKGGFDGGPLDEFAGSASLKGENNVLFVTDRRATWFAAPGLWKRIVRFIQTLRRSEGIQEVVTLGNSMGGYGALLLPRDVTVRRAIAFAPQVTMDRSILDDTRWPPIHDRWGPVPVRSVRDAMTGSTTRYHVTAGGGCAMDVAHLDLLAGVKRLHSYVVPGGRHNIARALKEAGLLPDLITAMIKGRPTRVSAILSSLEAAA